MAQSLQEVINEAICANNASSSELLKLILRLQLAGLGFSEDGNVVYVTRGVSFSIPPFDSQEFTYYGSSNNIETQIFKNGADIVATLTYTYVGGAVSDNDLIETITQS